jgi:hypothetical protein
MDDTTFTREVHAHLIDGTTDVVRTITNKNETLAIKNAQMLATLAAANGIYDDSGPTFTVYPASQIKYIEVITPGS